MNNCNTNLFSSPIQPSSSSLFNSPSFQQQQQHNNNHISSSSPISMHHPNTSNTTFISNTLIKNTTTRNNRLSAPENIKLEKRNLIRRKFHERIKQARQEHIHNNRLYQNRNNLNNQQQQQHIFNTTTTANHHNNDQCLKDNMDDDGWLAYLSPEELYQLEQELYSDSTNSLQRIDSKDLKEEQLYDQDIEDDYLDGLIQERMLLMMPDDRHSGNHNGGIMNNNSNNMALENLRATSTDILNHMYNTEPNQNHRNVPCFICQKGELLTEQQSYPHQERRNHPNDHVAYNNDNNTNYKRIYCTQCPFLVNIAYNNHPDDTALKLVHELQNQSNLHSMSCPVGQLLPFFTKETGFMVICSQCDYSIAY